MGAGARDGGLSAVGVEIERKFLVTGDAWRAGARGVRYRQGYLTADGRRSVRVRLAGDQGFITIKGPARGLTRAEFEYPIPAADAEHLLAELCDPAQIDKVRYDVTHAGRHWVVDEFFGENRGLVVAEIELASETETVELPAWAGREVSGDPRYTNASLARRPYARWKA